MRRVNPLGQLRKWSFLPSLLPHTIYSCSPSSEPPAGQLRFAEPATVNFTANLLATVAKSFPSKYFSTGGDELNVNCYTQDNETQATLNATGKTLEQALDVFTQTTHAALEKMGKTPVVWEGQFWIR